MKCPICKRSYRKKRMRPYGMKRGKFWCHGCDGGLVSDFIHKNRKKTERQKAKKEIRLKTPE